ncbi:hypothetical protein [Pseudoclavibacter sp. CFCC 13611]|uniref:hypothetical protein n=1 Tax=Pseudoclavibacter sp. CFCC 13611 TaxID=2615178 RepID=UPI0013018028|nr:hypothetical protein [Pseudoclavibacter sp. CFCC 13611]KAB1662763.1 hypothetical protein F8O08_09330 [Pseudoclavibacter sp. CFCC 13611]
MARNKGPFEVRESRRFGRRVLEVLRDGQVIAWANPWHAIRLADDLVDGAERIELAKRRRAHEEKTREQTTGPAEEPPATKETNHDHREN